MSARGQGLAGARGGAGAEPRGQRSALVLPICISPVWGMDLENHCPCERPHSAESEQELEVLSRFFAGSVPCPQGELRVCEPACKVEYFSSGTGLSAGL